MSEAINYIYVIFSRFLDFVFNDMLIAQGVSIGWVVVSLLIFGVLVRSILNLPRSAPTERGIRSSHLYNSRREYYKQRGGMRRYNG